MVGPLPVAAVVVNWNNYDDTRACLESLQSLTPGVKRTVVVDNGSTDGSGDRIAEEFPDVEVCFTGENLGFGGGMNAGIDRATADDIEYLWLLNNDILFREKGVLSDLCSVLDGKPGVAGVSPLIREYPETDDVWFWRGFIDWDSAYAAHDPPGAFEKETDRLVSNDYITCCAFLVRAPLVKRIGGPPTEYFLYYEDVDFCARLREEDYRLLTVTDTVVHHRVSASTGSVKGPVPAYYLARNRIRFARKFDDRVGDMFYLWYALWGLTSIKWYFTSREYKSIVALLRGAVDGLRGHTGKGPYP
jgi:GT2 family glycosyltransferase